jgi:hypothetical protein
MTITTAGDRTPEAAIDAVERRFSVSRRPAKLIWKDAPPRVIASNFTNTIKSMDCHSWSILDHFSNRLIDLAL